MKWSKLMVLSAVVAGSFAAVIDTTPNVADTDVERKQAHKLGVNILNDEDNNPTAKHDKQLLRPPSDTSVDSESDDELDQYHSFVMSVAMIIVSEIGDKTFLIAALMAMRYSRLVVFSAAFSSLAVMTILSGIVGHALPTLLSQRVTQFLASVLFVVFGVKLLREGLAMSKDLGVEEELAEVEEEIASSKLNESMDIEAGPSTSKSPDVWYQDMAQNLENLASFVLSPVFIQVFVMTFLGEWGDRSQIATIAMAAGSDYWFVIIGAIVGHGFCTAAACIGGKFLATKISMRSVTLGGSVAFFIFSILYFYDAYYQE